MTIDRLSGAFLVLVGLFVVWERRVLPLGSTQHPGPGYVPLLIALLLILFGVILIVYGKEAPAIRSIAWPEAPHAVAILACCIFTTVMMERIGYRLTILLALGFLFGVMERIKPWLAATLTAGLAFGSFWLFDSLLRVPLPEGRLGILMEDTLQNLILGFSAVFTPTNILYSLVGCLIGTMVGVLPGVGPLAGISMLLPTTFGLDTTSAIILLAGIYYGSMYGGSTTSILMRIPGEAASVMTCVDGYAMARQGRAGPALAIAAIGSYIAGTLSVVGLMFLAPPLARFALGFGPPEYFCLLLCGLVVLSYMTGGSVVKNLAMISLGLMIGMIGIDQMSGYFRFSYGLVALGDGVGVVPVAVGLFGISEILATAGSPDIREVLKPRFRELLPTRQDLKDSVGPIGRGTILGFLIGIIPGSAHIISTFVSYAIERRISKHPERFGKGAIEGVAGPEAANNAASEGALVPLLALGVPTGPVPAVLLAALMVHGITPGPLFIKEQPVVFWGLIASMYVGNMVLLLLNLPMVSIFVNLLRVPYRILYPTILMFCVVGVYAVNSSMVDVGIMSVMGVLGYLLRKMEFETAPMVLGVVLASIIEFSFRQALAMSNGSYLIFIERPIAAVFLAIALIMVLLALKPLFIKKDDWRERLTEAEK